MTSNGLTFMSNLVSPHTDVMMADGRKDVAGNIQRARTSSSPPIFPYEVVTLASAR
jgi:hypothetical protein